MNPIKADKIQFGNSSGLPHIRRSTTNELVFFDPPVGEISLSNILERSVSEVITVSKTTQGSDFSTIQEAIDFLHSIRWVNCCLSRKLFRVSFYH